MTPQEVIRQFMATLVGHEYDNSTDFKAYVLDDAIKSASKFDSAQEVIDAMKADQVAAEKLAVEEVLGSSYAGKTLSQVSSTVLKADAKKYDVNNTGNAYYNKSNDSRSTVEALIKERKAYIFLEKFCGIKLESKYWITSSGSVTRWTGETTGNVDTGAITGADANITLQSGDVVEDRTLTAADLTELAQNYGDKATLSDDGKTIVIGTGIEKTAESVVPEEFVNTYNASTTAAQVINTGTRDWVVKATAKADTITSGGADSINSDAGNDIITVNGNGATIATGTGYDSVNISAEVKNVTFNDLNANDAITISGTFEVGEATIEDMVLVITDATGTRKVKFSDFTNATGATINIDGTSTTIGNWLTENGIDLDNLDRTTYAESVGVGTSSGNITADGEDRTAIDDDDDRTAIDPDYTPPTTKTVEKSATPDVTPNTASADFATATGVVTVNLDEVDTSAAGSALVDGAKVGTLSSTYPDASAFTRNGLTIHLLGELTKSTVNQNIANGSSSDKPEDSDGDSQINPLTLNDLTDAQRTIIAGLFKWWAKYALTLNEEAYGIGFESDTAKVKDIGLYFYNDSGHDGNLAAVWSWGTNSGDGHATQLMLSVNTYYYDNLSDTDVDGTTTVKGAGLLDRTLSHEFVHASMASNITYFSLLPKFIKEGTAELTHGIDDERGNSIFRIAYDADRLEASLDVDGTDTSSLGNAYAGGYMFLRYFARNAALQTLFDPEPNPLLITLTEGDDDYTNTLEGATILALGGDDTIDNRKSNVSISGGADNDKIWNSGANVTIDGGDGDDSIDTTNDNVIIDGGDGDDYINNSGYYDFSDDLFHTGRVTINGGAGVDTIWNDGSDSTISGGEGDDYITNSGNNVSILGGEGNDSIRNEEASNVLIDGGQGNDSIENGGWKTYSNGSRYTLRGGDNVTMSGGADDDSIRNYSGSNVSIDGGQGDDFIEHSGDNSTISGGEGNDSIYNSYYDAEIDNLFKAGSDVTISGGAGNDYIENNQGSRALIDGGEGNDAIWNYGSNSTIDGDAGDDSIYNNWDEKENRPYDDDDGSNVVFKYTPGEGNDTIYGFSETSTLSIADGAYTSQESGDDVIVTVGDGSVILVGAAALGTLNIEGEEARVVWTLDGTTATYGTTDETLITITGLKRGLTVNDDGTITGIDLDGDVITLSANVLGTSTVKVSGDCYLALGDDVEESTSELRWKISGTTATLRNSTTEGYTLSEDGQSIVYTPAQTGAAIATITGLKSGLTVNDDGTITGIDFNDDNTIYLSANVLGTTTVKVTGDYTLALGVDVPEPEEGDAEWKINGTTATLSNSTTAGYTLSDDERSITYSAAKTGEAIVTISGLKSGLTVNDDGTIDGIDVVDDTIYLSADVLGTTTVKVTGDYTLALGVDVPEPEEVDAEWNINGTTATLSNSTTEGYTLSEDGQSIVYTPAQSGAAIITITGLKSGLKVDDDGYIDGVDFDGENTIYLSANVLGTTTVKVTGDSGYTLALGDGVEESTSEPEWKITSKASAATTTAVLGDKMTAGYTLNEDNDTITYTSDKTTTIATLTGLKKGLTEEELTDGTDYDTDSEQITLYADVLGTTKVTVKDSTKNTDYTLLLGEDVITQPEETEMWAVSGTTATFKRAESAYFTESDDGKTINYKAETKGKTLATVSGLKSKLPVNGDGTITGIDIDDDNVITLSDNVLNQKKVTLKGNDYTLALGVDVELSEQAEDLTWKVSGTKATLNITTSAGYSCDGQTITYSKNEKTAAVVTLTGIKAGLDSDEVNAAVTVEDNVITLSADVLGTSKIAVKEKGYTLALDNDYEPEPVEDAWIISGTKATLSDGKTAGYSLSKDARSITYTAAKATGKAKATITGLAKGLTANVDGTVDGIELDGETITLSADALGTGKVTLKGDGYALALGEDVDIAEQTDDPEWNVSGTKATLNITTSAGYSCDGQTVTYSKNEKTTAVATISGLAKGLTANVDGTVDGIELDGETITLSADALGTSKVTLKGDGYALALGDDVDAVGYEDYDWSFNEKKQTATLKGNVTAGYSCDGSTVTYTADKKNATIATVTGVTDLDGLDFDGETVTLSGDSLTDKVSVSGNVAFEFGDDFNDATITGSKAADVITVNGTGVTINAGKGDDQLTTAGGNTFLYASGDGDDVIANFTEDDRIQITKGTANVTADDSDVKVTVGKGTITLSEAAGQTIYLLDKKGNESKYETTSPDSDSYWFIDDDFTTTPQLTDITAATDCMLGEMDIATDPTQLVQTTPIVTTSDKK